jgi:hypothetical protein
MEIDDTTGVPIHAFRQDGQDFSRFTGSILKHLVNTFVWLGIVGETKCPLFSHLASAAEQSRQRTTSKRAADANAFHSNR